MNKKLLAPALLAALGLAHAASAQEYDDRWYLTGSFGYNLQDQDRRTNDAPMLNFGLGKFFNPNWSVDVEFNYQNPNFDSSVTGANPDLLWSQYGASIDFRRYFISDGRGWNPYLLFGVGYQRSEEEYLQGLTATTLPERKEGNLAGKLGLGVQTVANKRISVRAEVALRVDLDDNSIAANSGQQGSTGYPHQQSDSMFTDLLVSVGMVMPLGTASVSAPASAPPPPPPQRITIDLNGVNFDFDRATLRPEAVQILNEAVTILQRYPDIRVEVAGHTDSTGPAEYNQRLSERRAKVVYDFLTGNGISSSRLIGPVGYGQTRPIAPNDTREGRARNRRTELNTQ